MVTSNLIKLVNNAVLLMALVLLFDVLYARRVDLRASLDQLVSGLILGVIGVLVMLTPLHLSPGLFFDSRSILLSVSGLFFGCIPTLIAVLITAGYRTLQGGTGALTGIAVIASSAGVGLTLRSLKGGDSANITVMDLLLMGVVTHSLMLVLMFTLPGVQQSMSFSMSVCRCWWSSR